MWTDRNTVWVHINQRIRVRAIVTYKEQWGQDPQTSYRIDEIVTNNGLYITWTGLFSTIESAVDEIKRRIK